MFINKLTCFLEHSRKYGIGYFYNKILEKLGFDRENKASEYVEKYYLQLKPEEREKDLKEWFKEEVGYPLDLDNPKTFDEKIQWLKLYDSTPIKTRLADKFLVREWVAKQIGEQYLIPLLGVWDSFDKIDFSKLPDQFVLKANHGSAMNLIVKDKNQLNITETKKLVDGWLDTSFGVGPAQEWQYAKIKRKVLAEKLLETNEDSLSDYKVYCFNGRPLYIQIIKGRFGNAQQIFMNTAWKKQPFYNDHYELMENLPARPKQLELMLNLSAILSRQFSFVRVDWYLLGDAEIYFGEMTFTPSQGRQHWIPKEADEMLGFLIELPKAKYIFNLND